jgi:hypothetical protein
LTGPGDAPMLAEDACRQGRVTLEGGETPAWRIASTG